MSRRARPRGPRAPGALAALLAVLVGGAVVGAGPATADATCDGVWVVVDATELGGSTTTRCAAGDPDSGLQALTGAGHDYTFVPRVPGMVCTIDQRPDPCNGAPADAYWSYWHAEAGGDWTYATRGAGERNPSPGDVEGWAFGAGSPPGTAPPAPSTGADEGADDDGADRSDDGRSGEETSTGSGGDGGRSSDGARASDGDRSPSDARSSDDEPAGTAESTGERATTDAASSDDGGRPTDEPGQETTDADTDEPVDDADEVRPRGSGADADDVVAGRRAAGEDERADRDDDADGLDAPRRDAADEVAVGAPGDERGWLGVATGAALVSALTVAALLQSRRRRGEA